MEKGARAPLASHTPIHADESPGDDSGKTHRTVTFESVCSVISMRNITPCGLSERVAASLSMRCVCQSSERSS